MKTSLLVVLVLALGACGHIRIADGGPGPGHKGGDTVLICHKGKKTMELPRSAAEGHMGHGDRYGRC
jgi:hypothetical protein